MEERKSLLKNVGCAVWSVYIVSVMLFAPYYNWKFAQKAGFVPWLFGGEIVGTFKGVLWPYFLWSDHNAGIRRQQAVAYFDALNHCGTGHAPTNEMLKEAIARADERSKILGESEGRKQLAADCDKIAKVLHADLDEASAIVPPPFLTEFHKKCVEDNHRLGEIMDQLLPALIANDSTRMESLQKDLQDVGKSLADRMTKQLQDLGLDQ